MEQDHISRLQQLFRIGEHNPITLRAIAPSGARLPPVNEHFDANCYPKISDRWNAFVSRAGTLNDAGYNIYTCLNRIRPDFCAMAVRDKDIETRTLLLIDLDRAAKCEHPASDEEIDNAFAVALEIEHWFAGLDFNPPTKVMSGNGVHLYFSLADLPNDEDTRGLIVSTLRALADRFNTLETHIDLSVSNAARITKLPGTMARKGAEIAGRPFREARFV